MHRPDRANHSRVIASQRFLRWRPRHRNSTFRFDFAQLGMSNSPADQISARYLNPRLRYYYFRFLETNVCHVGLLPPVSIFTFASSSALPFCICLPNFAQIGPIRDDVISIIKWRLRHRNSASGFVCDDFAQLGRSTSTYRPNFGEIYLFTAEN